MRILQRPELAPLTTLGLGGRALAEIRLDAPDDCERLSETLSRTGGFVRVLGGGSNLLVHDGDLPFVVLRPLFGAADADGHAQDPVIVGEEDGTDGQRVLIRAGAGMRVPHLLSWCARHDLAGLEGLVGVPGRLGGAVAMNAGAYGCSTAPLLRSLDVFTPERGVHTLSPEGWQAGYRHFSLASPCAWYMSVSALLSLRRAAPGSVRAVMKENLLHKKSGQPVHEHTAGCVFRNPEGRSAGLLLDQAGMKGRRRGAMFFSPMHANFLVHDVRCGIPGSAADALALIEEAKSAVRERFGVELVMEVKEWGHGPDER